MLDTQERGFFFFICIETSSICLENKNINDSFGVYAMQVWSTTAWVCLRLLHGRHADTTWPSVVALWDHCGAREESRTPIFVSGSTGTFGGSSIKVFNSKTGNCLDTLLHLEPEQRGHITALMFSTDGAVLYSAASDGSIVAWPTSAILSQQHKPIAALKSGFLN